MPAQVPLEELCRQLDITSIQEIATEGFEAALVMDELKAEGGRSSLRPDERSSGAASQLPTNSATS